MDSGWIKFHRIIFENGLWKNPFDLRLFLWLVGNAVHKKEGVCYGKVNISRGQILRSYRKLQEDLRYVENRQIKVPSLSVINRSIERLINSQRITKIETELGTLFKIVNYEKYQQKENKNETFDSEDAKKLGTGLGTPANAIIYGEKLQNGIKSQTFEGESGDEKEELGTGLGTLAEQQRNNNKNDENDEELINNQFRKFWDIYDKKASKENSIELWQKLSDEERGKIFESLPAYIESTPNKQYRKKPNNWLRDKCWNDEIIIPDRREEYLDDY